MIGFIRRLFHRKRAEARSTKAQVFNILRRDYGRTNVLPYGAMSRVAAEVGCTRQYVSQVARQYQWRTSKGDE